MSQWKNTDDAANSVEWVAESINAGSGKANIAANNTALFVNTTPGAFVDSSGSDIVGQFGVGIPAYQNTTGDSGKIAHVGWQLRRAGMGPVVSVAVGNGGGAGYTNGASLAITAGTGATNATATLVVNSAGNVVSVVIVSGGLFPNLSYITVGTANQALSSITVDTFGAGYNNGDILTVSNGTVNATATIATNATGNAHTATIVTPGQGFGANSTTVKTVKTAGGLATGNGITSLTITAAGSGYSNTDTVLVSNGTVNATATLTTNAAGNIATIVIVSTGSGFGGPSNSVVTILAANGANSAGTGATLTPVEASATFTTAADSANGATFTLTLGGRAGRVQYETLVAMSTIANGAGSNTAQFPQ